MAGKKNRTKCTGIRTVNRTATRTKTLLANMTPIRPILLTLTLVAGFEIPSLAQSPPIRLTPATRIRPTTQVAPAQPAPVQADGEPMGGGRVTLRDEEIALLKADYEKLTPAEREAMVATYKDLGVDLLTALGIAPAPSADASATQTASLLKSVKKLNFARTPEKVLETRAQLGLKSTPIPAADAPLDEQANWLHQNVLAGEWEALKLFLTERGGSDAAEMYAHVLQSTNQGDPNLLPEEILAISEACPAELTEWQLTLLAQLLKTASSRSSTGPFLDKLKAGTTFFGPQEDGRRDRTAKFLSEAGLVVEAFDYLPLLDKAREKGNTEALSAHARYHEARAAALGTTPEAAQHRRTAWDLYCEIVTIDRADFNLRREAMGQAIELLPQIPPAPATEWLRSLFANKSLAATGLEAVALKAMRIGNEKISIQDRASAILMMKDSVDALLNDSDVELSQLRVPLRLLTMSLVLAAEETIAKQANKGGVASETELLLRALPSEKWRQLIEPSLSVRAYKAFIGIALAADNTDMALELLGKGIEQAPGQSVEMADEFLRVWMMRLNPAPDPQRMNQFMIIAGRSQRAAAPLTRGRQNRNLDRLKQLLDMLDKVGANGRSLERVVGAFSSCHGKAETFRKESVVQVLGEVDKLSPPVAARLAEAMRTGLNGDWKSRDVQRESGTQRSASEIDALIEEGYVLALELINSAQRQDPTAWRYAMTKAALAYDHMQFRKQKDQDTADYNTSRNELFQAFGAAAKQYQAAVMRGELREDAGVYVTWFSIALGSSDLSGLKAEDLLSEGAENGAQIELIRQQLLEMPPDMAASHISEFARRIIATLPALTPEVKPGVIERACQIVGDHPAGALLRQTQDLYRDLLKDELHLQLTIDGSDQVGTDEFGVVLSLQYTAAIGRELGGFNQYLQNNVYSYIAGKYQPINFRDRLEKSINQAFSDKIELVHIGFFDSMNPPRSITVNGEAGWEEKPICYMVLKAKDPSADRLPVFQMDITTMDDSGMVVLPVHSNSVAIDAASSEGRETRPIHKLDVVQTIDTRDINQGKGKEIKIEVLATGKGVVPELKQILDSYESAIPGYQLQAESIEVEATKVSGIEPSNDRFGMMQAAPEESDTYVDADEDGIFRLTTTRKWVLKFVPESLSSARDIHVPKLVDGLDAVLKSERFVDMDLQAIETPTIPIRDKKGNSAALIISIIAAAVVLPLSVVAYLRLQKKELVAANEDLKLPQEVTPFSAIITLQRFAKSFGERLDSSVRNQLEGEIRQLEKDYFGADAKSDPQAAKDALARWHNVLSKLQAN